MEKIEVNDIDFNNTSSLDVYTDGACFVAIKAGGYGIFASNGSNTLQIYGYKNDTTNQQMELLACIRALINIPSHIELNIYTDSMFVKNGIEIWSINWIKNNWQKASGSKVKNQELWQELIELVAKRKINWHWIKAHNNNYGNEKADMLAKKGMAISTINVKK